MGKPMINWMYGDGYIIDMSPISARDMEIYFLFHANYFSDFFGDENCHCDVYIVIFRYSK